jgi:CheY-like chemotaxis protein
VVQSSSSLALVVEDEWFPRMDLADALAERGWEVVECATGEQAMAFLASGAPVQVLVTDIRLPGGVNGWDVAMRLRTINPHAVVIYCSGNPVEAERQVSASTFLSKPCDMDKLLKAAGRPGKTEPA